MVALSLGVAGTTACMRFKRPCTYPPATSIQNAPIVPSVSPPPFCHRRRPRRCHRFRTARWLCIRSATHRVRLRAAVDLVLAADAVRDAAAAPIVGGCPAARRLRAAVESAAAVDRRRGRWRLCRRVRARQQHGGVCRVRRVGVCHVDEPGDVRGRRDARRQRRSPAHRRHRHRQHYKAEGHELVLALCVMLIIGDVDINSSDTLFFF